MISIKNIIYKVGAFAMDVSLDVGDDEYCVLFGKTGCGKTSLLEIICGLRQPMSGCIEINGVNVVNFEPRERSIGYVPQDGVLFEHLSVRKNIEFPLRAHGVKGEVCRQKAEATARAMKIGDLLERHIHGLSGGEKQRVALARAVVGAPKLLLLDEPVSALDEYTRDSICQGLVELRRKLRIPVLHVCHSIVEAEMVADKMAVMRSGKIIDMGTVSELKKKAPGGYVAGM